MRKLVPLSRPSPFTFTQALCKKTWRKVAGKDLARPVLRAAALPLGFGSLPPWAGRLSRKAAGAPSYKAFGLVCSTPLLVTETLKEKGKLRPCLKHARDPLRDADRLTAGTSLREAGRNSLLPTRLPPESSKQPQRSSTC